MGNIGYRPIPGGDPKYWPDAGYMTAPAGYSGPPILLYVRTAAGAGTAAPRFLYLDPSGDKDTGYHLREVMPVTDPTVPMGEHSTPFDLATGTSWGRFAMLPTSMAIHSNGYVVAVNPEVRAPCRSSLCRQRLHPTSMHHGPRPRSDRARRQGDWESQR